MDCTSAETMMRFLSFHFEVKNPIYRFNRRNQGYCMRDWSIELPKNSEIFLVMHEYAHHLDRCRNFVSEALWKEWHSRTFYYNLKHVILATGWGLETYPWRREYRQIERWARKDRLVI